MLKILENTIWWGMLVLMDQKWMKESKDILNTILDLLDRMLLNKSRMATETINSSLLCLWLLMMVCLTEVIEKAFLAQISILQVLESVRQIIIIWLWSIMLPTIWLWSQRMRKNRLAWRTMSINRMLSRRRLWLRKEIPNAIWCLHQ